MPLCVSSGALQGKVDIVPGGDLGAVIIEFQGLEGDGRFVVARVWGCGTATGKPSLDQDMAKHNTCLFSSLVKFRSTSLDRSIIFKVLPLNSAGEDVGR